MFRCFFLNHGQQKKYGCLVQAPEAKKNELQETLTMRIENLHYLAFGGGGARGIAFAGACAELWSLLRFDVSRLKGASGTSIGALYAAAIVAGMHPTRLLEVASSTSLIDLVRPHVTNLVMHWGSTIPPFWKSGSTPTSEAIERRSSRCMRGLAGCSSLRRQTCTPVSATF